MPLTVRCTVIDHDRTSVHNRTAPLLGFIVNPVAGMGGSVGLKGTDGEAIVHEAMRRGASSIAGQKAAKAILRLIAALPQVNVLTVAGPMGEQVAREAGIEPSVLDISHVGSSTSVDTRKARVAALRPDRQDGGIVLRLLEPGRIDAPQLARAHARRKSVGQLLPIDEPVGLGIAANDGCR